MPDIPGEPGRGFGYTPEELKKSQAKLEVVVDNLKVGAGIAGEVVAKIVEATQEIAGFFWSVGMEFLGPIIGQIFEAINTDFLNISQEGFDKAVENIGQSFDLDSNSINVLKGFYQVIDDAGTIPQIILIVFSFVQLLTIMNQANTGKVQQAIHKQRRPFPADMGSTIRAAFLDPGLADKVWELGRRNGLEDSDIELMFAAQYTLIDPNTLREIYFRHNKSEDWAAQQLFQHGLTPDRIKEMMSVWPVIPSVQDIVYLMGREAFEPDQISRFGLAADQPEQLEEFMRMKGLSAEWAQKYWIAHWQNPALNNVFEMYHRDQIDEEQMDEYFKLVEIPPFWRQRLKNVAYNVLTRVDVRRIHKMGVIDDEGLIKSYMHQGYSRENAEIMSEFTIEYNESDQRSLTKADIEKAYEDRDLDFFEAMVSLIEIGYRESAAAFYLSRVDLEMERAVRLEHIDLIKDKFLSNLITEAAARNELMSSGVVSKRINELMERWKVTRVKNAKLPSKTDVDKMMKHGIISEGEYRNQMLILGYKEEYIEWFYQLAKIA